MTVVRRTARIEPGVKAISIMGGAPASDTSLRLADGWRRQGDMFRRDRRTDTVVGRSIAAPWIFVG